MKNEKKLYEAHLFVCTNKKANGPDCGSKGSEGLLEKIKNEAKTKWGKSVRVNRAGCLGQCERGIAAACYPSGKWLLELTADDAASALITIQEELDSAH